MKPNVTLHSVFLKLVLFFLLFCPISKLANALEVNKPSHKENGIDEYGSYIKFKIPISKQSGSHASGYRQGVTTGRLTVDGSLIAEFSQTNHNWDNNGITVTQKGGYVRYTNHGSDGNSYLEFYYYAPQNKLNKTIEFKFYEYVTGWYYTLLDNGRDGSLSDQGEQTKTFSIKPENPIFPNPSFQFEPSDNSGEIDINYTYTSTSIPSQHTGDYTVKHWLSGHAVSETKVTDNSNVNPSGTLKVPISNDRRDYTFHTEAKGKGDHMIYTSKKNVTVPAYIWPSKLSAQYSDGNSVKLSWTVPKPSGSDYIDGDAFEIYRSMDENFSTGKSMTIQYDPSKEDYELFDNISDMDGGKTIYYRLRRTKTKDSWNWNKAIKTQVEVAVGGDILAYPLKDTVINQTPAVIISWKPYKNVWLSGTTFEIKKINNTTGSLTNTFKLNESEARSGRYVDKNIPYCNKFRYEIEMSFDNQYGSTNTEVPGSIMISDIGQINDMNASKGYYPDRTELNWYAEGNFDYFIVRRKEYGASDESYKQIAQVSGTNNIQFTDEKGIPGTYYQYAVVGAVSCGGEQRYSQDTLYAIGFRSPTGNIYGKVTFKNGQGEKNVAIRLENKDKAKLGKSVYLNGQPQSFLVIDSLKTPFSDTAFTFEAWIKPEEKHPEKQVIFSSERKSSGAVAGSELGFDNDGKLYFSYAGNTVKGKYENDGQEYIHVTGIYRKIDNNNDSLKLMLDDSVIAKGEYAAGMSSSEKIEKVYFGKNDGGNNFKGHIDEIRAWNIALSPEDVAKNYTILITGKEEGLVGYWRLDEGIPNQFYDLSHKESHYHKNDGSMAAAFVSRTKDIPTPGQLSLKGYTDSTGNYFISGIPYYGQGSSYEIVPLFRTHQFDPGSISRLISESSPSFNVDFVDVSSFKVTGNIYYNNTTVPVPDVMFKIDGQYAQSGNGELIVTESDGSFAIDVPVGQHEVQAVKSNHVFVNEGKLTNRHGENLNYQDPAGPFTLYDSTKVKFIGRVAGGAIQKSYPVGFSLSENNLGEALGVTFELPIQGKYNLVNGSDSTIIVKHFVNQDRVSEDNNDMAETKVVYSKNKITVYPDTETGEFEVNLIPTKFLATPSATGWDNWSGNYPESIDLTNELVELKEIDSLRDSTLHSDGSYTFSQHHDTVFYNYKQQFIQRVEPSVEVFQVDINNNRLPYFGEESITHLTLIGEVDTVTLFAPNESGLNQYVLGFPIFKKGRPYQFKIKTFEAFPFYMEDGSVKKEDKVPTSDGVVHINNNATNEVGTASVDLDDSGEAFYQFRAGNVDFSTGQQNISVNVTFGQAENVQWSWNEQANLTGFVLGEKSFGNDFVTTGPNQVLAVLRDPPGSKSYSFFEQGTTLTATHHYSKIVDNVNNENTVMSSSPKIITFVGLGAGIINITNPKVEAGVGVTNENYSTWDNSTVSSTTLNTKLQTSGDPSFVGPDADVYFGYSTNIIYGLTNNLIVIDSADRQLTDEIIYPTTPGTIASSKYYLVKREGVNFGQTFGTTFSYTQKQIIEKEIPKLRDLIKHLLLPPNQMSSAQNIANVQNKVIYVSKLEESNPNFGKANENDRLFAQTDTSWKNGESYRIFFPNDSIPTLENSQSGQVEITDELIWVDLDSVYILNQQIDQWEEVIAKNEEKLLKDTSDITNYSVSSGSPIDYSESTFNSDGDSHTIKVIAGLTAYGNFGVKSNGMGVTIKTDTKIVGGYQETNDSTRDTTITQGFHLETGGTDDYLSVDVADPDGIYGFGFRTKGGATSCPYEPVRRTKYYKPGTVLGQPTVSLEIPKLSIDNPVANDIPSTRKASYTLQLSNQSGIDAVGNFTLEYASTDSVKGATIAVDGASIADGRSFSIKKGQDVSVELTLEKGNNAMNYNEIPIILRSSCQSSLADTVFLSAHFVPSCSDIQVKAPSDQWTLNTLSPKNQNGKRYVPITLNDFDKSNSLFDRIELQYKPSSNSEWITTMQFYGDSAHYNDAESNNKAVITDAKGINYNLVMDDGSFSDQRYDIRALAVCKLGPGSEITTASNVVSGIKDTYEPRIFGTPEPANGILGLGEDIKVRFNESIASGLLTTTDFHVTGIRNGAKGDHSVSVRLNGENNYIVSEFEKNFTGKDITVEMWVLPESLKDGTVFSQGNLNESMELAFTKENHLRVRIGDHTITSKNPMGDYGYGQGEWAHVALEYDAKDSAVSVFYNFEAVINKAQVGRYQGNGLVVFGKSISKEGNYFAGKIHDARVWSHLIPATTLQTKSLEKLSGAEGGLLAYYPMNEGRGKVILDEAHGNNAYLTGDWSTPPGKAIALNGNGYVRILSSTEPITSDMDYTMSLWFKTDGKQDNATLASNGKGDGTAPDTMNIGKLFHLGFENGILTFRNNGVKVQAAGAYDDGHWHQVVIAVNRVAGNGRFYVDDTLRQFFNAKDLGSIESPYIYLGARTYLPDAHTTTPVFDRYFNGQIDEFRLWNTYLSQTVAEEYGNVKLKGDELGLLYYYPFEKYYEFQGQKEMDTTLMNQVIQNGMNKVTLYADLKNAAFTDEKAPIKDRGPVSNLNFDFVVNNDAVIINVAEPKQVIDKRIITLQLDNVRDKNGNPIVSPVTWTAYIDQNPLNWGDEELNLTKELNESMEFESYVMNSGGSNENFTISNLPPWLSANITHGTVAPKEKQKITFTINKGLNVGKYDEIAYLVNDNGQSQALSMNIKVEGDTPEWEVDPAAFEYNMDVYGKIRIDGIFSNNPEDMLAAFVDGKCVGMTYNSYLEKQDFWYAFLTIYSNELRDDNIEFRVWNASNGKVYVATPSQPISFVNDSIVGTPDQPVIFDGKEMVFQNINLVKGWNWISFGLVNQQLTAINSTLSNGDWHSGDIVKHEERGFSQYADSDGWVGTLSGFDNTSLFKMKTAQEQTLSVNGTLPKMKDYPISVHGDRWSYIGYLPQANMTLEEALADYEASDGDQIKSQTGFAMYSSSKGWIGSLTVLEPGKGYMLYRKKSDNTQFIYPSISGSLAMHRLAQPLNGSNMRLNPDQSPVESNYDYAANMTLIAVPEDEFHLQKGDQLLAYVNGELRGKSKALYNPMTDGLTFFMNISGESNQPVSFEIKRSGETELQSQPVFSYRVNSKIGTLKSPYVISFNRLIKAVQVAPNPFRKELRIEVELKEELAQSNHTVQISVFNSMGQLVYHFNPKKIKGSAYRTTWNGNSNNGKEVDPGLYIIQVKVDDQMKSFKIIKQ